MSNYGHCLFLALALLLGCERSVESAVPLRLAVAANAQYCAEALIAGFQGRYPQWRVETVVGSSGKLSAQIRQRAPFDIFLSADTSYPQQLYRAGLAAEPMRIYAYGEAVIWTLSNDLPLDDLQGALFHPDVHHIAIAQPELAPYGQAAKSWLEAAGWWPALERKIIYGESIAQVNHYITSGACELGITARSVVMAPDQRGRGRWRALPVGAYPPIAQGLLLTPHGAREHPEAARAFIDFLLGPAGQSILTAYGYGLPAGETVSDGR